MTFNGNGSLKTMGFGASYLTPMTAKGDSVYKNTFARCRLTDSLRIQAFSWEAHPGDWIDTTTIQFAACAKDTQLPDGPYRTVKLPLISGGPETVVPQAISKVARRSAEPSRLIPIDAPNDEAWFQILMASTTIRSIYQKTDAKIRTLPSDTGKAQFVLPDGDDQHLLICIPGINHILSSKEIEGFNTRLDTEDYASVTVISLGKISDEAQLMYVRLQSRKNIEVLVNRDLTREADRILSPDQQLAVAGLDAATCSINILIGEKEAFALVIDTSRQEPAFYIVDRAGKRLHAANQLVAALRGANPEFARMRYAGDETGGATSPAPAFDEQVYLSSCYREYNVIKYAALASVGIRFSDLPLNDLYVEANASEVDAQQAGRLEAVVGDHLATFPFSDSLKEQIKQQLLTSVRGSETRETSRAREFCQKYGAVLVIGDPGSGKTCFVKNEILSYCRRRDESLRGLEVTDWYSNHLPVMVQLSELVAEKDLEEKGLVAIASRLLARRGLAFPEGALEEYSKLGRIAWFFDGLDEVVSVERRALVVQRINELVTSTLKTGNRVIVTSRPAAIHVVNLLPTLHKLEIQGLSEAEIRMLAERILRLKLVTSGDVLIVDEGATSRAHGILVSQLVSDCQQNPGVGRLAQNPLLLTLLILIYANSGAPSAKRHLIYEQAIQTLASVRGREAGHTPISVQDLRERLGAVAISVYKKESGLLPSRKEVCDIVQAVMSSQRGEPASAADANAFIQRVAESTGLIAVENRIGENDEDAVVTFMHHSFLEFFAAVGLTRDIEAFDITSLVNQPRWHEILTLVAGIIGENEDVAPILAKFIGAGNSTTDVDARLLTFALDCALECEVPSESAQRLLARAVKDNIENGPARLDPWVRSELGLRVSRVLAVCGEGEFDNTLAELIRSPDADTSAAAINTAGYACANGYESASIVKAIDDSSRRVEEAVLCAICNAAAKAPSLRTDASLQVIARCLRKTDRCKTAALEAIADIPRLAGDYWAEIIENIDDKDQRLSRAASQAALRAGLNADVISLKATHKDILLRALQTAEEFSYATALEAPEVTIETVDRLWASGVPKDRLLAIQLLPATRSTEQYLYDRLMPLLRGGSDHKELVAVLTALRESKAIALFKQGDLRTVTELLRTREADVRIAAIKLLNWFGGEIVAVEALLSRPHREISADEYVVLVSAFVSATALSDIVDLHLFSELDYLLHEDRKRDTIHSRKLKGLFAALRKRGKTAEGPLIARVKRFIADYKTDSELRAAALLSLPAISPAAPENVRYFTELYNHPPVGVERALVQVPTTLAQKCRESVESVVACVEALGELRTVVVALHQKIAKRPISEETEYAISQLRSSIDELTQIIVAFEEFIQERKAV